MLSNSIKKLMQAENLSADECKQALALMMKQQNDVQVGALLCLLGAKGETVDEFYGLIQAMRALMRSVHCPYPVLDIVGTGGDGFHTVNISTASALLAASCGVRVVKHGNRSVSSLSGSADVLQSLGVNIDLDAEGVLACVEAAHFGFCFAPNFHPAMAKIKHIRQQLAVPTVFNMMGPLLNPAHASHLMIGVANKDQMDLIADVLLQLGVERGLVFHTCGLDEMAPVGPINLIEVSAAGKQTKVIDPLQYGFDRCSIEDLRGGSPDENADIIKRVLAGEDGPIADALILNAGFANYMAGVSKDIESGIALARRKHRDAAACRVLSHLITHSQLGRSYA